MWHRVTQVQVRKRLLFLRHQERFRKEAEFQLGVKEEVSLGHPVTEKGVFQQQRQCEKAQGVEE